MATVTELFIYPVKSCRGISVPAVRLHEAGLAHDRQWMLVGEDGRFVTQRSHPAMARIEPLMTAGVLRLRAPGMDEDISLPVDDFDEQAAVRLETGVFDVPVQTYVEGERVNQWLSDYLKQSVRLVRYDVGSRRRCGPAEPGAPQVTTQLADAWPLLIVSTASIDELNRRLQARGEAPVGVNRFRPNIVIDDAGFGPHEEDGLETLEHADYALHMATPCERCSVPNLDHATGRFGEEPTRTLREYRQGARGEGVMFGVHAWISRGAGTATIRVGDALVSVPLISAKAPDPPAWRAGRRCRSR